MWGCKYSLLINTAVNGGHVFSSCASYGALEIEKPLDKSRAGWAYHPVLAFMPLICFCLRSTAQQQQQQQQQQQPAPSSRAVLTWPKYACLSVKGASGTGDEEGPRLIKFPPRDAAGGVFASLRVRYL